MRFGMQRSYIVFGALMLFAAEAAHAQDKHEYSDQFLTNKQGELCTMCEADVVCGPQLPKAEPPDAQQLAAPAPDNAVSGMSAGTVKLHFYQRGFFGQMSTVLDYFPLTRKYGLSHTRDVDVTQEGSAAVKAQATLNLETKRIDIQNQSGAPMFWINRTTNTWHSPDGAERGVCTLQKK